MNRNINFKQAKLALARKDFFYYSHLKAPDFYKKDRKYLVDLCHQMQEFYYSDLDILVVNLPPRHGKSRTVSNFVEWLLGQDTKLKIITGSYNELLSTTFSKNIRNTIQEIKADDDMIVYSDIFPNTRIKRGDSAMNLWSLEGGYNNYLATSPSGTTTGFGADIFIIDDLIKNAKEAYNSRILDEHWAWFTQTMMSRLEKDAKIIIVMTRWHSKDLAGRAVDHFTKNTTAKVKTIVYKALQEDGTMLCEDILNREDYDNKVKTVGLEIASANYQQEPIDIRGKLYSRFSTYEVLPTDKNGNLLFEEIKSYTDTADTGSDYLCSIIYGVYQGKAYILDIYYTKEPMEITEQQVAFRHYKYKVNRADIESNGGGRSFARTIVRLLREKYSDSKTIVKWFHQSQNKEARILSNASWVQENILYPVDWEYRWPEYYRSMNEYQKEGKNAHDDAQDATTGVAEKALKRTSAMRILT